MNNNLQIFYKDKEMIVQVSFHVENTVEPIQCSVEKS